MLLLLSFLLLFSAAVTGLLLLVDTLYARSGADRRLDHAQGRHWAPRTVLVEDHEPARSLLPTEVRPRLGLALGAFFLLGCAVLVLAS